MYKYYLKLSIEKFVKNVTINTISTDFVTAANYISFITVYSNML